VNRKYQEYLSSQRWALLRNLINARSNNVCERCGGAPHESTHHLTYKHIFNESLSDLQAVCNPCHRFLSGRCDNDPINHIRAVYCYLITNRSLDGHEIGILDLVFSRSDFLEIALDHCSKVISLELGDRYFTSDPETWLGMNIYGYDSAYLVASQQRIKPGRLVLTCNVNLHSMEAFTRQL